MKTTIILVATLILSLSGCAVGSFPQFPDKVKNQYTVDIRNQPMPMELQRAIINQDEIPEFPEMTVMDLMIAKEPETLVMRCLKFEIVSQAPYKIKYISLVELMECNGVTGFKPGDAISVYNWMDDVYEWAKDRKKCFK